MPLDNTEFVGRPEKKAFCLWEEDKMFVSLFKEYKNFSFFLEAHVHR